MSPLLLIALVVGQLALASAALALSRVVQELQLDARRPGGIVEYPETRAPMVRPPQLDQIERLVTDSLASDVAASRVLAPLLAELGHDAPGGRVVVTAPGRDRRRWAAETVARLEQAWDLDRPHRV